MVQKQEYADRNLISNTGNPTDSIGGPTSPGVKDWDGMKGYLACWL